MGHRGRDRLGRERRNSRHIRYHLAPGRLYKRYSTPWATTDNVSITGNTSLSASREIYTLKIGTTTTGQVLNIGTGQSLQLDSGRSS